MTTKRAPAARWVLLILGILIVVPLLVMVAMMAMGSTMMGGGMRGMTSMGAWGLAWMVVLLAFVVALLVIGLRGSDRR